MQPIFVPAVATGKVSIRDVVANIGEMSGQEYVTGSKRGLRNRASRQEAQDGFHQPIVLIGSK